MGADLRQIDLDGQYADILERSLYNSMLTGMSIDGKAFTYINQMATCEANRSNKREEWFECACCPPNVARVLGHIGGYLWTANAISSKSATINVHNFASATLKYTMPGTEQVLELQQTTDYPWSGVIDFTLKSSDVDTTINIRIPSWAGKDWNVSHLVLT